MGNKGEEVLRLENIVYSYDNKKDALKGISLRFFQGEKVVILGQNGSGKSTLFLCCNLINSIKSGSIFLEDRIIGNSRKDINDLRKSVGIVFQNPNDQIIASNVYEEISFGPMNLGLTIDDVRKRVESAISSMNLESYKERMTQYLSGGEQKRVTIADILAMYPKIMLFDEPMSSLDMKSSRELEEVLDMLSDNKIGVVVATHNVDFAWRWADRIIVINEGQVINDSTPEELFSKKEIIQKAQLDIPILVQVSEKLGINPPVKSVSEIANQ